MVDEISSQFAVPFPGGQLGQPGGPQQISCVDDLCTVTWPSPLVIENGTLDFLITGATSNPDLNRPVSSLYHQNSGFNNGFTFNATGIGTQTFTAMTDPLLTLQMFASQPLPTPSSTGYVHNDAIRQIMSYINAVPGGPPNVTWPAAAAAPPANFGAWAGPGASNYADLYFTYLATHGQATTADALAAFNFAWNRKYSFTQPDEPTLMEVGDTGVTYSIVGTPIPIAAFNGNTISFSEPHGIVTADIGVTRLSVSGASESSLNGNYYVYNVVNATSVQVYRATSSGPSIQGGTVTFADGQVLNLTGNEAGYINTFEIQMDGTTYCLNKDNFGKLATISGSTYAPYNGQWYVFPVTFDNTDGITTCTYTLHIAPVTMGPAATGGVASIIADNYFHPGVSTISITGGTPALVAANIMYAAEKGATGVRVYQFGDDANVDRAISNCFTACSVQQNPNPFYNGPNAQTLWNGMSNAFNLIHDIEPLLLQPQLPAPNYGATMITGARRSSYGTLLMMTEFATSPQVVTVDLSPYNPSGGSGRMYILTGEDLSRQSVSGTSMQVTFAPGETVAFTFPPGN